MRLAWTMGVAFFMGFQATAWAQQDAPVREGTAEPPLESVINHFFPGYAPVPLGELTDEIGSLTVSDPVYDTPDRSPVTIKADFDGNGFADYALLISKVQGSQADEIFVILMGHGEGRFGKAIESFFGRVARDIYLGYLPAGTVLGTLEDAGNNAPPMTLASPAVTLNIPGQVSDAFYWDSLSGHFVSTAAPTVR
jgi:hypothetical protein